MCVQKKIESVHLYMQYIITIIVTINMSDCPYKNRFLVEKPKSDLQRNDDRIGVRLLEGAILISLRFHKLKRNIASKQQKQTTNNLFLAHTVGLFKGNLLLFFELLKRYY